jgi:hypothetical protein
MQCCPLPCASTRVRVYVATSSGRCGSRNSSSDGCRRNGESLAGRLRRLNQGTAPARLGTGLEPIDLPVDGPEVEAEVHRFAIGSSRLSTELLIVRATQTPTPDWMAVDKDQGWGERATKVVVHDIAADHLGVLREPHVRSLARAVTDVSKD